MCARAIIDRQASIDAIWSGPPDRAPGPRPGEWALPPDQLGEGAKYYQYNPEARRLLAKPGIPRD